MSRTAVTWVASLENQYSLMSCTAVTWVASLENQYSLMSRTAVTWVASLENQYSLMSRTTVTWVASLENQYSLMSRTAVTWVASLENQYSLISISCKLSVTVHKAQTKLNLGNNFHQTASNSILPIQTLNSHFQHNHITFHYSKTLFSNLTMAKIKLSLCTPRRHMWQWR